MRLIKSPEERSRMPIGVALFLAVIYGMAMLYFWMAVLANGIGGWIVLGSWMNMERIYPVSKKLIVGFGTASIVLYSYIAVFYLSTLSDTDFLSQAWFRLCFMILFIGSLPIVIVSVTVLASLLGVAAAISWVITRAGRKPNRWLDRIRKCA